MVALTEGKVIDYAVIRKQANDDAGRYRIQEIDYDPWNAEFLCNQQLEDVDGHSVVEVRQTMAAMCPAKAEFENVLRAGRIRHGDHPFLSRMASHAVVRQYANETINSSKKHSTARIDGLTASIIALCSALVHGPLDSIFNQRGLPKLRSHSGPRLPEAASPACYTATFTRDTGRSMPPAIVCKQLVKRYEGKPPVEAVRGLDLEVEQGECFGLLGPNGAGKTTTLEILEGLLDATSGEVQILGFRWARDDEEIRRRIGISLQETRLADKLTVRETLMLFRSFYPAGITPDEAIRRVSLEEKSDTWVSKLSGGQKQRLAVGCAIVGDPQLLFLDEPTTGLDPQSRRQLWDIIHQFRASGRTVMLTTHYMDEAERLCDRVAIVDHGKVIALGTPAMLIAQLGGEHMIDFSLTESSPLLEDMELNRLPSVRSVRRDAGAWSLAVEQPHVALPALLALQQRLGASLAQLTTRHATLEDVFVSLTGRHLEGGGNGPA